ncbi:MAG: hypothetical protein A4E49_02640 [Methanosaeta sp. PtaU1.Bin112]|nr:MAG: hypothetical protein A4E49_02640 [Methanosaeta sp. PtaU1.Bin112]
MSLLAIDVGAGTQDILLYSDEVSLEGSTKMVLPSQTVIVGNRINRARLAGRDVFLRGPTMGGGASTAAVRWHLAAGLRVYATASAAATINDNLERVAALGVTIQEEAPEGAQVIDTGDIDIAALAHALQIFEIEMPADMAVAVQDHGFSPERSNRLVRFEHLTTAIRSGGRLESFAYRQPPQAMTRMQAVKAVLEREGIEPLLMDTGPAAIFGAALDLPDASPALIINFGNGHTVAAILADGRITAIFEHHTSELSQETLGQFLEKLCDGTLKSSEVFEDGGHGAYIDSVPGKIETTLVTGPRRQAFLGSGALKGAKAASPGGDMMITGCIGLVNAWKRREDLWR